MRRGVSGSDFTRVSADVGRHVSKRQHQQSREQWKNNEVHVFAEAEGLLTGIDSLWAICTFGPRQVVQHCYESGPVEERCGSGAGAAQSAFRERELLAETSLLGVP
jgi:hypothetical protein